MCRTVRRIKTLCREHSLLANTRFVSPLTQSPRHVVQLVRKPELHLSACPTFPK